MLDKLFYKGNYGIERETLRVDGKGKIALTPHPFPGSSSITSDVIESQLEIITPVCSSIDEVMKKLDELDAIARSELEKNGEKLWLYSNPPRFDSEAEIIISQPAGREQVCDYYNRMIRKYGKSFMLLSGVHFNFSFDESYLQSRFDGGDYDKFKGNFYIKVLKHLLCHSWLIVLLTAASPVYDRSLFREGEKGLAEKKFSSVRNGSVGFWNKFIPILNYDSLHGYAKSIQKLIDEGLLYLARELYLPMRLKPKADSCYTPGQIEEGVSHIEMRLFDVNPKAPLGIDKRDLEFTHLLIMYLSTLEDFDFSEPLQTQAVENHKNAALYDLSGITIDGKNIIDRASMIISDMASFWKDDEEAVRVLEYERRKLLNRLCEQLEDSFFSGLYPVENIALHHDN